MYYLAIAADYDGTIAHNGVVDPATFDALKEFKAGGRRLILVTGRELPDLKRVFPKLQIFDRVVAENGALIYDPSTEEEWVIGSAPPPLFIEKLKERKIEPLSVGRSIVATWEPQETAVLEVIRDLGLELQIIFNKGAVMILPSGMNKAVGLEAALVQLELSAHNVVAVGDAENDHAFLHACGCSAAVANALPTVKASADIVLAGVRGAGVIELLDKIRRDDARIAPRERQGIPLGTERDGKEVYLEPHGSVLIAGSSGTGKSTLATALAERMVEKEFEFCVFDPEGDYDELEHAVSIGDATIPPKIDEALKLLRQLRANVVINTQALTVADRPPFFAKLLPHIASLRARMGRPHWLLIDETHQLLPAFRDDVSQVPTDQFAATVFITVHPEMISIDALKTVQAIVALGENANETITAFCNAIGVDAPERVHLAREDEVLLWTPGSNEAPRVVRAERPRQSHKRHTRKYAEGDLGTDRSFYFRGPENALNLRAQNLMLFLQIAEGVDAPTWEHHLRAGDYSAWFRTVIKDDNLARDAAEIEADESLDASESRKRMREVVSRRYIAPASAHET